MTTKSLADYDRAIQLNPNDANAYSNRGYAKYALGRNQEAIADYDRAIQLDSNNANAYNNRGYAKYELTTNKVQSKITKKPLICISNKGILAFCINKLLTT